MKKRDDLIGEIILAITGREQQFGRSLIPGEGQR